MTNVTNDFSRPISVADGGTGANTPLGARTNLGITIGARDIDGTPNQIDVANPDGALGNPTVSIATDPVLPGTGAVTPPRGQTVERHATPVEGMIRGNTDTGFTEVYSDGAWRILGREIEGTLNQIDVFDGDAIAGNPVVSIADNPEIPGLEALNLPGGTTLERPLSPQLGDIRKNTDTNFVEVYSNSEWNNVPAAVTAFTQIAVQTFTTSGTYTPTSGMKYCIVEVVGGGGGGGGVAGAGGGNTACGAGGGSGGYALKAFSAATIGASQPVAIGAAGTGGPAGNNNGGAGGTTQFGLLLNASGGAGGIGMAATGTIGFSGAGGPAGIGSLGDTNARGAPGGRGVKSTTEAISGIGGSSIYGGGGAQVISSSAGTAAGPYGSGGSGGASATGASQAGGNGSAGFIIVREFI